MTSDRDDVIRWIAESLTTVLDGLEAMELLSRHLHPPILAQVIEAVGSPSPDLERQLEAGEGIVWPERLTPVRERLVTAMTATKEAFDSIHHAKENPQGVLAAYRSLRGWSAACESLYPLAGVLVPVSRYFLEPEKRSDEDLLRRLSAGALAQDANTGLLQSSQEPGARGGFSLYVPETYTPDVPHPLIMALHGGSGSGHRFLWSWVREARTRGAILVTPTARGDTWSMTNPDWDGDHLVRLVDFLKERWTIDPSRVLLTGLSDGGTFSYLLGFREGAPFTHIAPMAASFHPLLLQMVDRDRLAAIPVHLVHGALDWMFPVQMAREARDLLTAAGNRVVYREIADLSHTYPREMNSTVLDWMGISS